MIIMGRRWSQKIRIFAFGLESFSAFICADLRPIILKGFVC